MRYNSPVLVIILSQPALMINLNKQLDRLYH